MLLTIEKRLSLSTNNSVFISYSILSHHILSYSVLSYCTALHCIVSYCIALYCIVLYDIGHCIVLYCIVLHCILSYSIISYSIPNQLSSYFHLPVRTYRPSVPQTSLNLFQYQSAHWHSHRQFSRIYKLYKCGNKIFNGYKNCQI